MKAFLLCTTALCVLPTVAMADPISAAIAATASAVVGAGGIGATTFSAFGLSLSGGAAVFAHFAIRAALGYALNALSPKPTRGAAGRGYNVNTLGPALPHAVIYGETRVGGAVFYQNTSDSERYLHRCIAFAGHEVESYEAFYLNDEELTLDIIGNVTAPAKYAGKVRIKTHLGTASQTADTDLVSEVTEWTTDHRARGVAYAYVRFDGSGGASAFGRGIPTLTARIRGKKVSDPRSSGTAWSDNPALVLRDYILSDYGLDDTLNEIDDAGFEVAADVCDELVGSEKRYTCNGTFTLDNTPESIISGLISSMAGMFWYAQGQWGCRAAKYTGPSLSLNEDDLVGEINIATRNSRRQNFNLVQGIYRGAETDYQESDFTPITDAAFVTDDGGFEVAQDMQLLFTDTDVMAQRIATIALKRNRKQVTVTAPFNMRAMEVGIGDTVMLSNNRAGWSEKVFEVNDWRFGLSETMVPQVQMLLREIDDTVFV